MPELIDRQRAITEIESCFCSECDCGKDKSMCGNCEYLYCMDILEQQPTIEAEPVRHGRWDNNGTGSRIYPYLCTECKESCDYSFPYCPICGAKMDGGADNDSE